MSVSPRQARRNADCRSGDRAGDERISKPPPLRNTKMLQYRFLLVRTAALQTRSDLILTFGLNVRASRFVPQ
jgi:hypothetical protein